MKDMSETKKRNVKVVESKTLSGPYDRRFVVVAEETGNVLDDAQGYGYKSKQKAMAAWSYKNRDKSKDAEKRKKQRMIKAWLKDHRSDRRASAESSSQSFFCNP